MKRRRNCWMDGKAIQTSAMLGTMVFPMSAALGQGTPSLDVLTAQRTIAAMALGGQPAATKGGWTFFGSWRVRDENQNWWPTDKANGAYNFIGSLLRAGVTRQTSREETTLELAVPALINLPTKAVATAPQGPLGQGANYYATNGSQVASLFVKQGFVRFKNFGSPNGSLKLGRFEFSDGGETAQKDPTLNWLKQNRISQRLIGPFGYTHVGRSFDGIQFAVNNPNRNVTALLAFPTRGVFSLNGSDTLTDVRLAYLSATYPNLGKKGTTEGRLFAVYYDDQRGATKTDNRSLAARTADKAGVSIITVGGDYLRTVETGIGKVDGLLWGAGQWGQWGALRHGASSFAAEIGFQPKRAPLRPWLRVGYYYASGDGAAGDNQHGTFFPILPTPRIYARYPFFTESNLKDLFAQVLLRPNPKLTVRADIHSLQLADGHDLWYAGGGAYDNQNFGYAGRPSGGGKNLASLVDLSADYQFTKSTTLSLYLAYAKGEGVINNIYKSGDSVFGYAELNLKF